MITIKDVARDCCVSFSTAAAALRGERHVAISTRERVIQAAARLGYRRNPFASTLARANLRFTSEYRATVALLDIHYLPGSMQQAPRIRAIKEGIERHGARMGFRVELFRVYEEGLTGSRLSDILASRGIEGVLLYGVPRAASPDLAWPLDWNRFAVVVAGERLSEAPFHFVCADAHHAVAQAIQQAKQSGFRRIGLIESPVPAAFGNAILETTPDQVMSAFQHYTRGDAAGDRVPPLLFEMQPKDENPDRWKHNRKLFEKWWRFHRPEIILCRFACDVLEWLGELEVLVPREVSLIDLSLNDAAERISGVEEHPDRIGELALDLLINSLREGERGIPQNQRGSLIQGRWREGHTAGARRLHQLCD